MDDSKLMDYAMGRYGFFNLPEGMPKTRWRGNYVWESGNDIIDYRRRDKIYNSYIVIKWSIDSNCYIESNCEDSNT